MTTTFPHPERNTLAAIQEFFWKEKPDLEKVSALMQAGINPHHTDHLGNTLLHMLAMRGSSAQLTELLALDPPINAANGHGETPLHMAANSFNAGAIAQLIHAGANINATSHSGITPLMSLLIYAGVGAAEAHTATDALEQLASQNEALLDVQNANGETAFDLAMKYEKTWPLATRLLAHGAHITSGYRDHAFVRHYLSRCASTLSQFQQHPDVTALSASDIIALYHLDAISEIAQPSLWEGNTHHLLSLLSALPSHVVASIISLNPDVLPLLDESIPSSLVSPRHLAHQPPSSHALSI